MRRELLLFIPTREAAAKIIRRAATALLWTITLSAQTTTDPLANAKLAAAYAAFAGVQSPRDVRIEGLVTEHAGTDTSGTFIYESTADGRSKLQLNLAERPRTEFSSSYSEELDCAWTSAQGELHKAALHNCLNPSAWLLPLLSITPSQSRLAAKFSEKQSKTIDSLWIVRNHTRASANEAVVIQALSGFELVLDKALVLPSALRFDTHADNDARTNIPIEITYSDYRDVNGIKVPFSIKKSMNGSTVLEFAVTSALFNTGTEAK